MSLAEADALALDCCFLICLALSEWARKDSAELQTTEQAEQEKGFLATCCEDDTAVMTALAVAATLHRLSAGRPGFVMVGLSPVATCPRVIVKGTAPAEGGTEPAGRSDGEERAGRLSDRPGGSGISQAACKAVMGGGGSETASAGSGD